MTSCSSRFDCGTGSAELQSEQRVLLQREVYVTIKLLGNMGYLSANNEQEIGGKSQVSRGNRFSVLGRYCAGDCG